MKFNIINPITGWAFVQKNSKAECLAHIYWEHANMSMTIIITEWPNSELSTEHTDVVVQSHKFGNRDIHYRIEAAK